VSHQLLATSGPSIGDDEIKAVERVLRTGFLGMGPEVEQFENELRQYLGFGVDVCCVNTGTSALHVAMAALNLPAGSEILIPSLTYVATFQAATAAGLSPIACDVLAENGQIDLDDAARRMSDACGAIVPVHYAGHCGDLDAVYRFAEQHGLRVIEDAAHAFGSSYRGQRIGTTGDVVCFSFDPIKNLTSGEGGAVVTRDAALIDRARVMRRLGIEPRPDGDFDVMAQGWRFHMPDIMAAIGRAQLARFEADIKPRRQALARAYRVALDGVAGVRLFECADEDVAHIVVIRVGNGQRDRLRQCLAEAGYDCRLHYKPSHLLTRFERLNLPVAEQLYREILTMPTHEGVTLDDIAGIVAVIRDTLA
jgi:dTDP-4-amino-4,6-dideoxygalactose transaminase